MGRGLLIGPGHLLAAGEGLRFRHRHLIPDASDGLDQMLIIPQLLSQMADVDIHSPGLPIEFSRQRLSISRVPF